MRAFLLPYAAVVSPSLLLPPGHCFQLAPPSQAARPSASRLGSSVAEESSSSSPPSPSSASSSTGAAKIATTAAPTPQATLPPPPAAPAPPDLRAYAAGYKTVFRELPCARAGPTDGGGGALPADLRGTYYKAGPAMFSAGSLPPPRNSLVRPRGPPVPDGADPGRMVAHPFEGDGAVLAVTFHGDRGEAAGGEDGEDDETDTAGGGGRPIDATARFRYVRTNAFTNERKKGKKLYTGMEGTRALALAPGVGNTFPLPYFRHHLLPGLNKSRKNTSNTRAVYFGSRLLSLWGGGLPYKLDALALSTEGRTQLGGAVKREEAALGATAAIDPRRNRALFFGVEEGQGSSTLTLYEFNARFQPIRGGADGTGAVAVRLPGLALVYDFAITENYAVFVQPRFKVNGMQYMLSKEPGKTLELEGASSLVHIVGRPGNKQNAGAITTLEIPYDGVPEANLQFINAYEEEDGTVVFDALRSGDTRSEGSGSGGNCVWPWVSTLADYRAAASKTSLWRYRAQPRTGAVAKERLSNEQLYFGIVKPADIGEEHRYIYATAGATGEDVAPPQGLVRLELAGGRGIVTREAWFPAPHEFCGEPAYAPRWRKGSDNTINGAAGDDDDGYIVATLFDGLEENSSIVVLQANNLAAGPVARVPLGMAVPHGFHGCFAATDDASWTHEEIERRAKLADKMETRGSMWNEVKSDFSGLGLRFDDMEEYFGDLM